MPEGRGVSRNWSSALDEVPVERIRSTLSAIRGANQMAEQLLAGDPKQKAYVAGHDEVADALEAYITARVKDERGG